MIRAVVLSVDGRAAPPPELQAVFDYEAFGLLPEGGGSRDQVYGDLRRMYAALNYRDLWEVYRKRPAGWEKILSRAEARRMIEYVLKRWPELKRPSRRSNGSK